MMNSLSFKIERKEGKQMQARTQNELVSKKNAFSDLLHFN